MRLKLRPTKSEERRATILAGLIVVQGLCALFFISDVIEDFREDGLAGNAHLSLEAVASVALIVGVAFLMIELRRLLARMAEMQTGLEVANGNLMNVIDSFFGDWALTKAEQDVAMMILKGLDNDTIARLRNTASGTVRAQATKIYAKSGTDGRAQFISLFMEELLAIGIDAKSGTDAASVHEPIDKLTVEKPQLL